MRKVQERLGKVVVATAYPHARETSISSSASAAVAGCQCQSPCAAGKSSATGHLPCHAMHRYLYTNAFRECIPGHGDPKGWASRLGAYEPVQAERATGRMWAWSIPTGKSNSPPSGAIERVFLGGGTCLERA